MAKADFTFKISVDGNDVNVAVDQTKKLRQEVDKTSKATDRASGAASRYKQNMGSMGVAGNARDFSKLSQTIGSGNNGVVGAYATLAANTFAVVAAFTALQRASNALKVMAGLEAQGARLGQTLSLTADSIREVTGAALSMADSMRQTAQLTAAGFQSDQIAKLAQVAKDAAGALGRDLGDSMDRLTRGVTKLEPELLDEIGLMTKLDEASSNYAITINKTAQSLTAAEKRQAFMNSVLEEGTRKFGGIGDKVEEFDAYTRLAAAGTDLFNTVVGALATALAPIAEFFADNKLFLAGAVLLYASTIRDQLLPALSEAAAAQAALVQSKGENLTNKAAEFGRQAAELEKVEVRASNGKFAKNRSGPIVSQLAETMKAGEADAKSFTAALATLNEEYEENSRTVENSTKKYGERYDKLQADLGIQRDAIRTTRELGAAHHAQGAAMQRLTAIQAGAAASWGNYRNSIKAVTLALIEQNRQLTISNAYTLANYDQFGAGFKKFTLDMSRRFAILGTAAKVLGTAFLNIIPVLGQLMFAVGLVTTAWSFLSDLFTTDEQKAYNKVQKDFNTILEASADKMEEYNRLAKESNLSASAQVDALKLTGNAVKELTDKFEELETAKKAAADSSLLQKFNFTDTAQTGSRAINDAMGQFQFTTTPQESRDLGAYQEQLKLLDGIYGVVNKEQKALIDTRVSDIASLSNSSEAYAQARDLAEELGERFSTLSLSTENLAESFKNLEKSTTQFIQSATISTPVDAMLKDLQSTTNALTNMEIEMQKGALTMEEYGQLFDALGANSQALLGPAAADMRQLAIASAEMKANAEGGAEELQKYRAASSQVEAIQDRMATSGKENLLVQQKKLRNLQEQYRQTTQMAAEETARFKKISDQLDVGGAAYLAREAHAEKMRKMEADKLDVELAVLKVFQSQQDLNIQGLKNEKASLQIKIDNLDVERARTLEIKAQSREIALQEKLRNSKTNKEREEVLAEINKDEAPKILKDYNLMMQQLDSNITAAEQAMTDLGDSVKSLEAQKAAILAENLSEAHKQAMAISEDFKIAAQFFKQLNDYSNTIVTVNRDIDSFNRLLQIRNNQIQNQVDDILNTYTLTRKELSDQLAIKANEAMVANNITLAAKENVALTELEITAARTKLEVTSAEYANEQAKTRALFEQADITARLKLLQLAMFDAQKEGIEWQQKALDLLQKEADLSQDIIDKRRSIATSIDRTSRILSGLPETDQSKKNEAIEEATAALKSAKDQAKLRISAIEAEYALMHAQKIALQEELRARMGVLRAMGVSEAYLAPVQNAVRMLEKINVSDLRDMAVEGVKLDVRVAEQNLVEAVAKGTTIAQKDSPFVRWMAKMEDERTQAEKLEKATEELRRGVDISSSVVTVADNVKTGISEIERIQAEMLQVFESSNDPLKSIDTNVAAIAKHMTGSSASAPGLGDIRGAADYAAANGFRVGEGPGYGGVTVKHQGSAHDEGRAYDVNIDKGNVEANIPHMKKRMDALAKTYQERGFEVIWNRQRYLPNGGTIPYNSSDHDNHLHVERPATHYSPNRTIPTDTSSEKTVAPSGPVSTENIQTLSSNINASQENTLTGGKDSFASRLSSITAETAPLDSGLKTIELQLRSVDTILQEMAMQDPFYKLSQGLLKFSADFSDASAGINALAEKMGPDGEIILAMSQGVSNVSSLVGTAIESWKTPLDGWESKTDEIATKVQAVGSVISGVLDSIGQISKASSDARVRGIDAEIAAEQKRDGKSAESMKKIAGLEKKKDQIKRKQFQTDKKLMMAQAVIATATGVAQALASGPPPYNFIMAGIVGAMGAAQLAIIAGTTYQGGSVSDASVQKPAQLSIGRVGNSVNLDKQNANAGGEVGYLRGTSGYGSNASNYKTVGSAYGGMTNRGYGHRQFLVGEKGPETVESMAPMRVKPDTEAAARGGDTFVIQATDAESFERMLRDNPVPMIEGMQKVANSSGQSFMEDVDIRSFGGKKK